MKRNIEAVKEAAPIEDEAQHYGEFRPSGEGRLLGRCISPDHEDRTPSMTVYIDRQTFRCYGCGAYGDVLDMLGMAERCELHEALLILSQRHGVELPGRPDSWYRKQERQKPTRDAVNKVKFEHLRRRLYRAYFAAVVVAIEDEEEREEEAGLLWDATENMARLLMEKTASEKAAREGVSA